MKIVIFAGGTGKRLWPLSRKETPKQFQAIFGEETSLENSFNTIKEKFSVKDIYVSTGDKFAEDVFETLPGLPRENLILEPESRDTGPAVAYAMLKISQKFPDEPVVIRWQNSLIKNPLAYRNILSEADKIFQSGEAQLVYIAVPSKYPNSTVGYIKISPKIGDLEHGFSMHNFEGFTEKPQADYAKGLHSQGHAWNPGCYITTPRFILKKLEEKSPAFYKHLDKIQKSLGSEKEWEVTKEEFSKMDKIAIDYLLWEKLDNLGIKIVLGDFGWNYISTWSQLKDALLDTPESNLIKGNVLELNSHNNLVYNYDKAKIIALVGVEGLEVIVTPDAVLVCNDQSAAMVKDFVKLLEEKGLEQYL